MSHYRMTDQEKSQRRWARKKIIGRANAIQKHYGLSSKPYSMRRIQDAIFLVRQRPNDLTPDDFVRAGFNPPPEKKENESVPAAA